MKQRFISIAALWATAAGSVACQQAVPLVLCQQLPLKSHTLWSSNIFFREITYPWRFLVGEASNYMGCCHVWLSSVSWRALAPFAFGTRGWYLGSMNSQTFDSHQNYQHVTQPVSSFGFQILLYFQYPDRYSSKSCIYIYIYIYTYVYIDSLKRHTYIRSLQDF